MNASFKNPKLLMILFVIGAAAVWVFMDYQHDASKTPPTHVKPANTAPDISFRLLDKERYVKLSDYAGRYVLINIWASWCAPCAVEFPDLLAFAQRNPNTLQLITLSVDQTQRLAVTFLNARRGNPRAPVYSENILHAWDIGKHISQNVFQSFQMPESILIGPDGTMLKKYAGIITASELFEIERMFAQ